MKYIDIPGPPDVDIIKVMERNLLDVNFDDMVDMECLNDAELLNNLKKRY